MKYPMIEKLGLRITWDKVYVFADDLEKLLASAQRVYGVDNRWETETSDSDTHTALLIAVEEIRKGVKKSEINSLEEKYRYWINNPSAWKNFNQEGSDILEELCKLLKRVEQEGIIE